MKTKRVGKKRTAITAERDFVRVAKECGSDPISEENAILSIDRRYLPACALKVLNGGRATIAYWDFLREQTEMAQAEHDREYAAGHEWSRR